MLELPQEPRGWKWQMAQWCGQHPWKEDQDVLE
jgi:hypothetical protein